MSAIVAFTVSLMTQLDTRRTFVEPGSNVRIETLLNANTFPQSWQKAPISAQGVQIEEAELDRALKAVRRALAKYPNEFLRRDLKRVVLLKQMTFFGAQYGGTNSLDTVYVTDAGKALGFTDSYIEGAVHHEFSSILLRNHPADLDQEAWKKALPPEFKYRGDGLTSVKTGTASLEYGEEYFKKGFLNEYATSSQEEDFNVTAEALLTGRKELWDAMAKNPLLDAKAKAVVAFYTKIEKTFDLAWFQSLKGSG